MVIHEVFQDVFRQYHTLKDLGSVLFKWAALVMLLVAFVVAASSPSGYEGPIVQAIVTVQRCVRVAQVGLILFLMVFSRYLGSSWHQRSFGISLGLGVSAAVELGTLAFHVSGHASEVWVNAITCGGRQHCDFHLVHVCHAETVRRKRRRRAQWPHIAGNGDSPSCRIQRALIL